MVLSSHLDPALTPIKSPNFFRRDAYARTYACLSAYLPTIDIWNEYKNQNPETLENLGTLCVNSIRIVILIFLI